MTDQLEEIREKLQHDEAAGYATFERGHANLTPETRQAFDAFRKASHDARVVVNGAAGKMTTTAADKTLYPEGARAIVAEQRKLAKAAIAQATKQQQTALTVLEAKLRGLSLPTPPSTAREALAREEVRLALDDADLVGSMAEIAGRDDELAAVVAGSFGESYLRARGVAKPVDMHGLVRGAAIAAAAKSTDPRRQQAAAAIAALPELEKAGQSAICLIEDVLEQADAAVSRERL